MRLKELFKNKVSFSEIDNTLLAVTLSLSIVSIFLLFLITNGTPYFILFRKEVLFFLFGVFLLLLALQIPLRIHYSFSYYYLAFSFVLLLLVLAQPGEIKRWIKLGVFQFQPSEFAKLAWIFALGRYLVANKNELNSLKIIATSTFFALVLFGLVLVEPDLGTAMVFIFVLLGMLFISGVRYFNLFVLISPIISLVMAFNWVAWAIYFVFLLIFLYRYAKSLVIGWAVGVANFFAGVITPYIWNRLYDYQRARILTFINPARDPFGAGYQLLQSRIAIGSGGLYGKVFSLKPPYELEFLPARYTDFIFSSYAQRFGFIGVIFLLSLFIVLLYRMLNISLFSRNVFSKFVGFGIFTMFFSQIFINIAMTIGLAPVTGLPLPFLTPGGSALFTYMFAVGVMLRIDLESSK